MTVAAGLRALLGSGPQPALLLHSEPSEVMDLLASCDGLQWRTASNGQEVTSVLAGYEPTVVFSLKHSGFPGEQHRPAIVAPSVRWFHVGGSGTDHLSGYDEQRVTVTTSKGVLAPFLAERAMAALLFLSTGLASTVVSQRARRWEPSRFVSLQGKTVLIVGAGSVGAEFAKRLRAFGVRTVGIRASGQPHPDFDEMHGPAALDGLLPQADVVSLHVPLQQATRGLLDKSRLELLPDGAIVLNSSRGPVVDEAALLDALDARLGGAWLDVFDIEPLGEDSRWWQHPKALVTPHQADQVSDYPRHFARRFVELYRGH